MALNENVHRGGVGKVGNNNEVAFKKVIFSVERGEMKLKRSRVDKPISQHMGFIKRYSFPK